MTKLDIIATRQWKLNGKLFDFVLEILNGLFDDVIGVQLLPPVDQLWSGDLLSVDGDLEGAM